MSVYFPFRPRPSAYCELECEDLCDALNDSGGSRGKLGKCGKEGSGSTKRHYSEAMRSGSVAVIAREPVSKEMPTPLPNVVYEALTEDLEVLGDVLIGKNSYNEHFQKVGEKGILCWKK